MSDLRGRPEVEPLSELAWARVERRLFEALDRGAADAPARAPNAPDRRRFSLRRLIPGSGPAIRRPSWAIPVLTCGAAAALFALAFLRGDAVTEEPRAKTAGDATARVATEASPSHLTVGDAYLTVAPHSVLLVDRSEVGAVRLILERGRVACRVAPRESRPPLSLLAGDVRIEVVGTEFAVTRMGDTARVVVTSGVVRVTAGGEASEVRAGEAWPAKTETTGRRGSSVGRDVPSAAESTAEAGERYARAAALEASNPDAALAIYRDLSRRGGPWAPPALFAGGRLALEIGRREDAVRLLERYLLRHPDGTNAADARDLLKSLE